ncbi:hypothetical protein GWI33_021613 [Rhynchophorus ferrugineus]|uniref:Uncharacterized protein n=1 Tax=Rhynchophorus ferrugineus TaxID=354439 RepID=A0A834MMW8_RHYFE|nr:hypothetical protein GWI33_021613 [Rhynchophorus ferrugineus]
MSATGILPTYQRFVNGMPVPLRRSFPSRVRSVICMVVVTFCLICFTTFFYLPEFKNSGGRVESMYKTTRTPRKRRGYSDTKTMRKTTPILSATEKNSR